MHRAILTGLGGRGLYWLHGLNEHPDVEVVAACEPYEPNRKRAVEKGLPAEKVYASLDEAIAGVDADFVMDVTPPAVHHEVAAKSFAAGLHVLGEKPLSDSYDTAKAIAGEGKKAGKKHMIAQNYRFVAGARRYGQAIDQGVIGKPGQCDVQFYMPWADIPGSHYVTQPYMLINDMMVHHFDLMRYYLKSTPTAVQSITWNQPWGWHAGDACHAIVFEFPGGLHATHVAIGCSIGEHVDYHGRWRIEGDKGSLSYENGKIRHVHKHKADPKIDESLDTPEVPSGTSGILDEFLAAINEDREPECNAEDNLLSNKMVFAAIKSAKQKRRIELKELD